jgi:hypothetical protein
VSLLHFSHDLYVSAMMNWVPRFRSSDGFGALVFAGLPPWAHGSPVASGPVSWLARLNESYSLPQIQTGAP